LLLAGPSHGAGPRRGDDRFARPLAAGPRGILDFVNDPGALDRTLADLDKTQADAYKRADQGAAASDGGRRATGPADVLALEPPPEVVVYQRGLAVARSVQVTGVAEPSAGVISQRMR
jgi:hypothetical protein